MGPSCSRRKSADISERRGTDDDWYLIELPKGIQTRTPGHQLSGSPRAPTHISRPRGRWIKAVLKIRLLRQFRIRWARTGAWLNLHPRGAGTAPPEQRAIASRLWAAGGRAILQQYATRQLFTAVVPTTRLTRSDVQERARYRKVGASLRAELDRK